MTEAKKKLPRWVSVIPGLIIALLLYQPISYLLLPDQSLFRESGWKSYGSDREWRLRLLLRIGANPNQPVEEGGLTALHTAAQWGNSAVIRLLVENGADPSVKTTSGSTALDLACEYAPGEAVEELLSLGAQNRNGTSECLGTS